jgi:hypothetical protein
VADGNRLVFAELAPLFTTLLDLAHGSPGDQTELARAMAPAISSIPEGEGRPGVATAFGAYAEALLSSTERATLVLQGNTLAVAHEQQRLQPAIAGALDAAISDTLKQMIEGDVVGHLPAAEARRVLDGLTDDLCKVLDESWDTLLTEVIMQLITATETFDLRRDVPPLAEGRFPAELRDLAGSPAAAAVARWDRTNGMGVPSGAHDWARLEDRMNFVVNLFRSRQRDAALFTPPFSSTQLAVLSEGQLPAGPL